MRRDRDAEDDHFHSTRISSLTAGASDIVRGAPDLIVTVGGPSTAAFKQVTDRIPIVFYNVADPVADGLIASFARPGGNITGFSNHENSFIGKRLSILKELAPTSSM
jgi:putative ABC transport system substrate-binding protein